MTSRPFAAANPGLMQACLMAQDEANAFIAADHEAAAAAYVRISQLKVPNDQLMAILAGPDEGYSATPIGSLTYAKFMAQNGILKTAPRRMYRAVPAAPALAQRKLTIILTWAMSWDLAIA